MSSPTTTLSRAQRRRLRQRTAQLRRVLAGFDLVVSGSVYTRYRSCGKASCRCAVDPGARHGPYYQWSHREDGRAVHQIVTVEQADILREAVVNYHQVRELLAQWERETVNEIFAVEEASNESG